MNYANSLKLVSDNWYLKDKKVKYQDEIYTVIDIFPCPTQSATRAIFMKKYNESGRKIAVEHFMSNKDLDAVLFCKQNLTGQSKLIPLGDIEVLE